MKDRRVITIGNFDGVHRGHQAILSRARQLGDELGVPVCAVTFDPSPREVLAPEAAPRRLCSPDQRASWLLEAGADEVDVLDPRHGLLGTSASEFLEWLERRHHPAGMVEGPDFRFGKGRQGDMKQLGVWASRHGVTLVEVDKVRLQINDHHNLEVSSSVCRELLRLGRVGELGLCLGRPFTLRGPVTQGAQTGRKLGFPTANIEDAGRQMLPVDAVYAGWARVYAGPEEGQTGRKRPDASAPSRAGHSGESGYADGAARGDFGGAGGAGDGSTTSGDSAGANSGGVSGGTSGGGWWPAAISVGIKPTFGLKKRLVEAHLLGFAGDLYDAVLDVSFGYWIRDQQRFPDVEALRRQLKRDCAKAADLLRAGRKRSGALVL